MGWGQVALMHLHVSPFHSLPLRFLAGWWAAELTLSLMRGLMAHSPLWAAPQHMEQLLAGLCNQASTLSSLPSPVCKVMDIWHLKC